MVKTSDKDSNINKIFQTKVKDNHDNLAAHNETPPYKEI